MRRKYCLCAAHTGLPYVQTWPLCASYVVRQQREREYTLLSQSISFSVWHCAAKCFWSLMPLNHLSALAWVTAAMVGRPTNTSSSITEGRYNAIYVSHMPTNPIKRTQTLSELQIPINVFCSLPGTATQLEEQTTL